jgi:peptide chain release factor 1
MTIDSTRMPGNGRRVHTLELRPAEGGDDAESFAGELATALTAWARTNRWFVQTRVSPARTTILVVTGAREHDLAWLAGAHRVQRIPRNDARGRRHTSTVTLSVLPGHFAPDGGTSGAASGAESGTASRAVPALPDSHVRLDTFRGTGPGGQHRNKTDSAVRAVHLPTGLSVSVTRGRSQRQNRAWALAELAQRVAAREQASARAHVESARRGQAAGGSGGALAQAGLGHGNAKTFTYNDQRDEVVQHATGRRWRMTRFLRGQI